MRTVRHLDQLISNRRARAILRRLCGLLACATVAALVSSCGDPCTSLSETICKCEPTEARQQACLQRIGNEADTTVITAGDETLCEAKLDSCTCQRLADGDLLACGLTRD